MQKYTLVIHGGAGTLLKGSMTSEKEKAYKTVLENAIEAGFSLMENGAQALDAVVKAVAILEDSPLFNAGKGSVFTHDGTHEMDASIMNGKNRRAGAVSLITGIKNPIFLARDVMEKSNHVFLAGEGAMRFAYQLGYPLMDPEYFFDEFRYGQWQEIKNTDQFQLDHSQNKDHKFGTVGAVACDQFGNIAAATSTGGMTNKRWGRIGDSPLIGAGTYANNETCAVSCTGSGEFFIRGVAAYDVSCLMEFKGLSLKEAAEEVILNRMRQIQGDGGLIAVDKQGNFALPFNTEGMYRGYKTCDNNGVKKAIQIYKE